MLIQCACIHTFMHVCMYGWLFARLSACVPVCLSVCLSVCPSVRPSVCLSVCLYVCLSVYLFVYLMVSSVCWFKYVVYLRVRVCCLYLHGCLCCCSFACFFFAVVVVGSLDCSFACCWLACRGGLCCVRGCLLERFMFIARATAFVSLSACWFTLKPKA